MYVVACVWLIVVRCSCSCWLHILVTVFKGWIVDEGTSGKPVCCVRVYSCGIREFCSVRYCTGRGRMCACVMRHLGAIDEVWVEWSSGDNFAYFERVNEALRGDARACSNEARTVLGAWTESPRADDVMWDLDAFFFRVTSRSERPPPLPLVRSHPPRSPGTKIGGISRHVQITWP